jgi:hypothetical protein
LSEAFHCKQTQNEFLQDWLPLRSTYLKEILELEAPPASDICQICNQNKFKFRCRNCFHRPTTCSSCCAQSHVYLPFHSIDVWNGTCFLPSDLLHIGFTLHFGHHGSPCPQYKAQTHGNEFEEDLENESDTDGSMADQLQIVHSNGVCRRNIRYCKCSNAPPRHLQLLRHCLFPASYKKPQTAFTFEVLRHFHIEAMECKVSASAFYSKLKRFTSNAFPDTVPVSIHLHFLHNACLQLDLS